MIDSENLRAASLYINNQLLSRGLLRDGQTIDFADPEGSHGGLQDTMGRIISVVNDLILRRDRDAEHRESLSSTLRVLRADSLRQTTELSRQTEKLSDTQRRLDSAEATERALRAQLKIAEQGIQRLKEDLAKMKSLVAQTRSACANEVRKRDRQIDSLKKAIADTARVRGGGKSRDVITITVTGDYSALGDESAGMPAGATEDDGYSLRMETNEFLTELVKGLSEENEGLLALVRRTVEGLREMSGLDRDAEGSSGHDHGSHDFVTRPPQKSAEELAAELEGIVEHLRSILTNPSFAPIEEVEVRDEAIHRLRAGLETMEARWKDAVHMIDGWRKRMVSSGKSVDMEDLQMGLRLSPVRVRDVAETANAIPIRLPCVQEEDEEEEQEKEVDHRHNHSQDEDPAQRHLRPSRSTESLHLVAAPGYDDEDLGDDSDSDSSIFEDDIDINELDVEEPNVQILQISTAESVDSHALPEPSQIKPLKDSYSSGNRGHTNQPLYRNRPGDFTTIAEESAWDLAGMDQKESSVPPSHMSKPMSPKQNPQKKASGPLTGETRPGSTASYDSPLFGKSIERPAQTQSKRNLFSRPPSREQPAATTTQSEGERSPPVRTTRFSAAKSGPPSPVAPTEATEAARSAASDLRPTTADSQNSDEAVHRTTSSGPSSSDTKQARTRSPTRVQPAASSRLPRPNTQQQQSPLNIATIAAKLAASEREADAARVRAKLRAVRRNRRISGKIDENSAAAAASAPASPTETSTSNKTTIKKISNTESETETQEPIEDMDPVKKDAKPVSASSSSSRRLEGDDVDELALSPDAIASKTTGTGVGVGVGVGVRVEKVRRKRERHTSKVASRRRSTLSPWELQGLITGNVGGVGSPAR